jgi:hypothetical protein
MVLEGTATYIGQEKFTSKKGNEYNIVRFLDGEGKTFETMSDGHIEAKQFQQYIIKVDVQQGKYPKYTLLSFK